MRKRIVSIMLVFVMVFGIFPQNLTFSNENDNTSNLDLILGEVTPIQTLTNDIETAYCFENASFSEKGIVSEDGGYFTITVDSGKIQLKDGTVLNHVTPVDSLAMGENEVQMTSSTSLTFNINTQTTYVDIENAIKSVEFIIDDATAQNVDIQIVKGFSLEDEKSSLKFLNGKQYRYFAMQDGITYAESSNFATSQGGLLVSPTTEIELEDISDLFAEYKHLDQDGKEHLSFLNIENILLQEEYAIFDEDGYATVSEDYLEDGVIVEYGQDKFETFSTFEMVTKDDVLKKVPMPMKGARANEYFYVSSTGSDANIGTTSVAPFLTIQKAIDSSTIGNTSYIYLMDDITLTGTTDHINLDGVAHNGKTIIIEPISTDLDGKATVYRGSSFDASMITLNSTANLTLKNIILDGQGFDGDTKDSVFQVFNGSLDLYQCEIINHTSTASSSLAYLKGITSSVTIDTSTMKNNTTPGYGILLYSGTFEIINSVIENNTTGHALIGQSDWNDPGDTPAMRPLNFEIIGSTIQNNTVNNTTPVDTTNPEWKHALMSFHFNSVFTITDTQFINNSALNGPMIDVLDGTLNFLDSSITSCTGSSMIKTNEDATRHGKLRLVGSNAIGVQITGNNITDINGYAITAQSQNFSIAGKSTVTGNSKSGETVERNVYLPEGVTIQLHAIPGIGITGIAGSNIGVTTEDTATQHYPVAPTDPDIPIAEEAMPGAIVGGIPAPGYVPLPYDYSCFVDDHATPRTAILEMDATNKIVLSPSNGKYYVKNTGSDTTGNGSYEFPYATIQEAFDQISANPSITGANGATVYVMGNTVNGVGGTYTMSGSAEYVDIPGGYDYPANDITVISTDRGTDGTSAVPSANMVTVLRDTAFTNTMLFKLENLGTNMMFKDIIIDGNNVLLPATSSTTAFDVISGTVKLDNVTVQHQNLSSSNSRIFCTFTSTAAIEVKNSAVKFNTGAGDLGGSIFLAIDGSSLTLEDTSVTYSTNIKHVIDSWANETITIKHSGFATNTCSGDLFKLTNANFTLENSTIFSNQVTNIIYISDNATVDLKNLTNITNNLMAGYAVSGPQDNAPNGTIKMSGRVTVYNNTIPNTTPPVQRNVYLDKGESIKLAGPLAAGSSVGVTVPPATFGLTPSTYPNDIGENFLIAEKDLPAGHIPNGTDIGSFHDDTVPATAIIKLINFAGDDKIFLTTRDNDGRYYVSSTGTATSADGNAGTPENPYGSIEDAMTAIEASLKPADNDADGATIYVMDDMTIPAEVDLTSIGKNVTITTTDIDYIPGPPVGYVAHAGAVNITRAPGYTGTMFTLNNNSSSLAFKDIRVNGADIPVGTGQPVFNVVDGKMSLDGVEVQDHNSAADSSVFNIASSGELDIIDSSKINNNDNGLSVINNDGGILNVTESAIQNNTCKNVIAMSPSAKVNLEGIFVPVNITENTIPAGNYAVDVTSPDFTVKGEVKINNNTENLGVGTSQRNVFIGANPIKIVGPISGTSIGISVNPSDYPYAQNIPKKLFAEGSGYTPNSADTAYFNDDRVPVVATKICDTDTKLYLSPPTNAGNYYVKSTANPAIANGLIQTPYATIEDALAAAVASSNVSSTIYVMDNVKITQEVALTAASKDITITTTDLDYNAGISTPHIGGNVTIERDTAYDQTMFSLSGAGSVLTFKNINISGSNVQAGAGKPAFNTTDGIMTFDDVKVSNHISAANSSVFNVSSTGSLMIVNTSEIVDNGTITDNGLGSVIKAVGGSISIDDSTINNNYTGKNLLDLSGSTGIYEISKSTLNGNINPTTGFAIINADDCTLNIASSDIKTNQYDSIITMNTAAKVNLDGITNPVNITNNVIGTGYAVKVNSEDFTIKGNIQINNNSNGTIDKNVFLTTGTEIKLAGNITGSSIGVTHQSPPISQTSSKVVIAEKATSTPNYVPTLTDESIFFEDVNSVNLQIKWYDSTPTGDGKIYLEYIWDASPPIILAQSPGYTETVGQHLAPNVVSVTATDPINEPPPINGVITYQWYVNSTNSNIGGTVAPGTSINTSYSLPNPPGNITTSSDWYYCVVTNTNTNATGTITVATSVSNPVQINLISVTNAGLPVISPFTPNPVVCNQNDTGINITVTASSPDSGNGGLIAGDGATVDAYQWYSCDSLGANAVLIPSATSATYAPSTATVGDTYYKVKVNNHYGAATGDKDADDFSTVVKVTVNALTNAGLPVISPFTPNPVVCNQNDTGINITVTASSPDSGNGGLIAGDGATVDAYQWYSCDSLGANATLIPSATSATYAPSTATVGDTYYKVKVNNHYGAATGDKDADDFSTVVKVTVNALTNAGLPVISPFTPNPVVCNQNDTGINITVTASSPDSGNGGLIAGDGATVDAYQWYSCDSLGANATLIPSATSATYAPSTATVGDTYYKVKVNNHYGAATGDKDADDFSTVVKVTVNALTNAGLPVISPFTPNPVICNQNDTGINITVTASSPDSGNGGLIAGDGATVDAYQWYSCDSLGANATLIPSATSATYAPSTATVGDTYYKVKVNNHYGAATGDKDADDFSTVVKVTVNALTNAGLPVISPFTPNPVICNQNDTGINITVTASSPDSGNGGLIAGDGATVDAYQWYSCDSLGANATLIPSATSATYAPSTATVGDTYYKVKVNNHYGAATGDKDADDFSTVVKVTVNALTNAGLPVISPFTPNPVVCNQNDTGINITVTASSPDSGNGGLIAGDGATVDAYQWYTCDSLGNNALPISGATSATYAPSTATVGDTYYKVKVNNHYGAATGDKDADDFSTVVKVTVNALTNAGLPVISPFTPNPVVCNQNDTGINITVTASSPDSGNGGLIAGDGATVDAYQWYTCDSLGANATLIPSATSATYAPSTATVGDTYYKVKVNNHYGAATGDKDADDFSTVVKVTVNALTNAGLPVISPFTPNPVVCNQNDTGINITVTASSPDSGNGGLIAGDGATVDAYQWYTCDSLGANATLIPSATSATYAPSTATVGDTYYKVKVNNHYGAATGDKDADDFSTVVKVTVNALTNAGLPVISPFTPNPVVCNQNDTGINITVTASSPDSGNGGLIAGDGATVDAYQWYTCDSLGANATLIPSATSATYAPSTATVGDTYYKVKVNNHYGAATGDKDADDFSTVVKVTVNALTNAGLPVISPFTPNPVICNQNDTGINITVTASSPDSGNGGLIAGDGATVDAYQWYTCDSLGANATLIPSATSATYAPSTATVGDTYYKVKVNNHYGAATGDKDADDFSTVVKVTVNALTNAGLPVISPFTPNPVVCNQNDTGINITVTASSPDSGNGGLIAGDGATVDAYQWYTCDSLGANATLIPSATSATYAPSTATVGDTYYKVKVNNHYGAATGDKDADDFSTVVKVTVNALTNAGLPVISPFTPNPVVCNQNDTGINITVTASSPDSGNGGLIAGDGATVDAYQWYTCDSLGANATLIPSATSATYAPSTATVGDTYYKVKVNNHYGAATGDKDADDFSTVVKVTVNALTNAGLPVISPFTPNPVVCNQNDTGINITVTASSPDSGNGGLIAGDGATVDAYQWYTCDSLGANATLIPSATSATYAPSTATVGDTYYKVKVNNHYGAATGDKDADDFSTVVKVTVNALTNAGLPVISPFTPNPVVCNQNDTGINITVTASSPDSGNGGLIAGDGATVDAYQWYTCDSLGNNALPISGATSATYAPSTATVGDTYYKVKVNNHYGAATGDKDADDFSTVVKVTVNALTNAGLPVISPFTPNPVVCNQNDTGINITVTASSPDSGNGGLIAGDGATVDAYQWYTCDSLGANATLIPSATSATYAPSTATVGDTYYKVKVNNHYGAATGDKDADDFSTVVKVTVNALTNAGLPVISPFTPNPVVCNQNDTGINITVTASSPDSGNGGLIAGDGATVDAYQWYTCDSLGANATLIPSATSATYAPSTATVGDTYYKVKVNNHYGAATGDKDADDFSTVVKVTVNALTNAGLPVISPFTPNPVVCNQNDTGINITVTASSPDSGNGGLIAGDGATVDAYQWYTCDSLGANATLIPSATSATYAPSTATVGDTYYKVKVNNHYGAATGDKDADDFSTVVKVTVNALTNAGLPVISPFTPNPVVCNQNDTGINITVTASSPDSGNGGLIAGDGATVDAYQWYSCDSLGANATLIPSATSATYAPSTATVGDTYYKVKVNNHYGAATGDKDADDFSTVVKVTVNALTNAGLPVISPFTPNPVICNQNDTGINITVTASSPDSGNGGVIAGDGATVDAYQWYTCDSLGANATLIPSATSATYAPSTATVGDTYYKVKVNNHYGAATGDKDADDFSTVVKVTVNALTNAGLPVISPFTPNPVVCNQNDTGINITVTASSPDSGNGGVIAGDGATVDAYQWYSCDSLGANATLIPSATSATYAPSTATVGDTYYKVKVNNHYGAATGDKDADDFSTVVKVTVNALTNAGLPVISPFTPNPVVCNQNDTGINITVTASSPDSGNGGLIAGDGATVDAYQWYSCDSLGANATLIPSATSATYAPSTATVGDTYYKVKVNNHYGAATGDKDADDFSTVVKVTVNALTNAGLPVISPFTPNPVVCNQNDTGINITVTASSPDSGNGGLIAGDGATVDAYQWYTCDSLGANATLIPSATSATYAPSTATVGDTYYKVKVNNHYGAATGDKDADDFSTVVKVTVNALVNAQTPVVSTTGNISSIVGNFETITATATISDGGSLSYQWYECSNAAGANPQLIPGATSVTFNPSTSTLGTRYYIVVATNNNPGVTGVTTATGTSPVVTVLTTTQIINAATPNISTIPNLSVPQNNNASLAVNATSPDGGAINGWQWYTCDANGNNAVPISGATSATYNPPTNITGSFYYKVEVNNYKNVSGLDNAKNFSNVISVNVVPRGTTITPVNPGVIGGGNIDEGGGIIGGTTDNIDENGNTAIPTEEITHGTIAEENGVSRYLNSVDHFAYLVGYEDGTFKPENNMTRAEVSQTFYNLLLDKSPSTGAHSEFTDVSDDAWYADAVNTLSSMGIIVGYPDGSFKPDEPITRAEFVTIACKFAYEIEGTKSFIDVSTDYWASDEIMMAVEYGWVTGYEDGTFRPEQPITRAEAATIVNNMLGRNADINFIEMNEVQGFSDVDSGHWAYYEIIEATITHDFEMEKDKETWTDPNKKSILGKIFNNKWFH